MRVTVELGWAVAPAVITLASFTWAIPMREHERPTGGMFGDAARAFGLAFRCLFAASISLAVWLIWALMK